MTNNQKIIVRYTLRKTLFQNSITPSRGAYCKDVEKMNLEACFSLTTYHNVSEECDFDANVNDIKLALPSEELSFHYLNIIYYVTGKAIRKYLESQKSSNRKEEFGKKFEKIKWSEKLEAARKLNQAREELPSSSDSLELEIEYASSSESEDNDEDAACQFCYINFTEDHQREDWVRCIKCWS
ncbi:hypothetical protein PGB90_004238 [Kerria lacca]